MYDKKTLELLFDCLIQYKMYDRKTFFFWRDSLIKIENARLSKLAENADTYRTEEAG